MNPEPHINVRVTRRFDANPERVFDAWLDPASACKWLFATPTGQMRRVEIDGRVGGSYVIVEERNGEDAEHTGQYLEVDRPRHIVFTLAVEKYSEDIDRVTVDVTPLDQGCEVTITHRMQAKWAEWAGRTEEGWAGILEGLAKTLT